MPIGVVGASRLDKRRCAFCEGPGPLTREHVLPQHWREEFPDWAHGSFLRVDALGGKQAREVPGTRYDQTVRRFCGPCNGGWMQELDMAAKPLVLALANGSTDVIRRPEIATLTSWATKIGLVRAMTDGPDHEPAAELFRQFYANRKQFAPGAVQVATNRGRPVASATERSWAARDRTTGESTVIGTISHIVTYSIGYFAFQVAICPSSESGPQGSWRRDALASLAAARAATQQKFIPVLARDVRLGEPLTDKELMLAREPGFLRGELPYVGNP